MSGVLAWHFVATTLRDGRPVPNDGEVLRHDGPLIMCKYGLHASKRALDALSYTPGNVACRVLCAGISDIKNDKFVCSERTILWRVDATETLNKFARMCALDVAHLWNMPPIVRQYLETGEADSIKAARAAADAAEDAAEDTARTAAWDAASAAAWGDAWDAAWDPAIAATGNAAGAAAWNAANAATWNTAGAAAWNAARDAQNKRLTEMLITAAHTKNG